MELIVKRFDELTIHELYEILRVRVAVFVVEQKCPYEEIDGEKDFHAYHVFFHENGGIKAYARVIDAQANDDGRVSIGRVLTIQRGAGLGRKLMAEAIRVAKEFLRATSIHIEAQAYARDFYAKFGFQPISDAFLIEDIPHMDMLLTLE